MTNVNSDWMNQIPTIDFSDSTLRHDRILVVNDVKFHVRAEMLTPHSEYFDALFNSTFKEANEKEIKIEEVKAEDFRLFLSVVYHLRYEITKDNYGSLTALAFRFLTPCVLDACRIFIMKNVEVLDKIDLLDLAFKNNLNDVKEKTAESIALEKRNMCYYCKKCNARYDDCRKSHFGIQSCGFNVNISYISKNYERFFALPLEIQAFVFQTIVKINRNFV